MEIDSRLDPSQNSIDVLQASRLNPSPSVTHLPGAGGMDGEQSSVNSDSEKDDRVDQVPVYSSSQVPSESEPIWEPAKDMVVDGTHLPDDDDDDDDIRTTPFQSPILTQSVTSTPIPSSDSTDVGSDDDTRHREAPSLDEISAQAERLRVRLDSEHHHTAGSSADSHTVQGTPSDREGAAADDGGKVSSTEADHRPEVRREAPHLQLVEDTPNQMPDRSEPVIEDTATPPPPPYDAYESGEGEASREDTPTHPPANADSVFEEPPPPPLSRSGYSCRDDYVPMPGASRGGWMAYHEQIRAQVRDFVLDVLPKEWSEWVCHNVSFVVGERNL